MTPKQINNFLNAFLNNKDPNIIDLRTSSNGFTAQYSTTVNATFIRWKNGSQASTVNVTYEFVKDRDIGIVTNNIHRKLKTDGIFNNPE